MQEDPNKITYFAKTNSRGKDTPFGIKRQDRAKHMYVIGKTGMGKSTLLENLAIQDIRNGEGMAFIDPHGSTAERIMEYVPEDRIKDVIYLAPFDMEHPIAFNVMEDVGYDKRHLVVSGLMSAFKKLWVDAWSARMEYILSNTLLALLEYEGSTLLDVNTMYTNKAFRRKVVENIKDPVVKRFWTEEYANFTDRFAAEATPAIQNKVGQFTSNPLIRNIIGQSKSSFDLRRMMDEKKIIIINLSKGRVGEVNANLLGSMLVTKIYLAAMSRADVPASQLRELPNFYFYVDEFQSFANQSFADILSEARKYKLNLLIAHQYIEQMEEEVRDAVFGNVGTTIAFRVGPFDAEVLETIFSPQFMAADLVNLGMAQIYLTLMIDGVGSPPFSATTLTPFDPPPRSFVKEILESSRAQFAKPRAEVESTLAAWNAQDQSSPQEATRAPRAPAQAYRPPGSPERRREEEPSPGRRVELIRDERHSQSPREERVGHPAGERETPPPRGFAPVASRTPRPPDPRYERARLMGAEVGREHRVTAAADADDAVMQPPRPRLEGSLSLRDALRQVTLKKEESQKEEPKHKVVHALDLKETLGRIVSPTSQSADEPKQKQQNEGNGATSGVSDLEPKPVGLPEERLRSMLAVDGFTTEGKSE